MRETKREAAGRVLYFRVHLEGAHGPDETFSTRAAAEEKAARLRGGGQRVVVLPAHTALPSDPWLMMDP